MSEPVADSFATEFQLLAKLKDFARQTASVETVFKMMDADFDGTAKFDIEDEGTIVVDANGARVADEDTDVTDLNEKKSWVQNKDIWTGEYYKYQGTSKDQQWIPNALARDAVGEKVEKGDSCESLLSTKGKPGDLLTKLKSGDVDAVTCKEDLDLFQTSLANWIDKLK